MLGVADSSKLREDLGTMKVASTSISEWDVEGNHIGTNIGNYKYTTLGIT